MASNACGITADDLYKAYVLARLRKLGISYQTALMTPSIRIALRGTALALQKKNGNPAPIQRALI